MHHVGVDFYPEHWARETWPVYARQMREAGFTIVRLAEFAWGFMEPEEGRYDFSLFDEALEVLDREGIKVIMCTPTAVMPAWLARMAARVASRTIGRCAQCGITEKKAIPASDGLRSNAAPWPK